MHSRGRTLLRFLWRSTAVFWAAACGGNVEFATTGGVGDDGIGGAAIADPASLCSQGGPEGEQPVELGPPAGGIYDLWRNLGEGEGEGQSFIMPRAGVIDRVTVQIFAGATYSAHGACELRLFRMCGGELVLASTTQLLTSSFPKAVPVQSDQDLRETDFFLAQPLEVAAGDRVDAIFAAVDAELTSVITMGNVVDESHAVFPDGAPGIPDYQSKDWDYHARLRLR